jgi:hypothetical protein
VQRDLSFLLSRDNKTLQILKGSRAAWNIHAGF